MKLNLLKEKKEAVSMVLIWLTVVPAVLIVFKIGALFVNTVKAGRLMERAVAQSQTDANDLEKYFAKSMATAEELKKKNLFNPPVKKKNPVNGVSAILGKEALINGKWYKVGDKISDAQIKMIEPTYVKIEWKGKEKTLSPFDLKNAATPKKKAKKVEKKKAEKSPGPERESRPRQRRRGRRGMFQNLSDEERAELREKIRNMSREERREYMQQRRSERRQEDD